MPPPTGSGADCSAKFITAHKHLYVDSADGLQGRVVPLAQVRRREASGGAEVSVERKAASVRSQEHPSPRKQTATNCRFGGDSQGPDLALC
jgi:hypothetical protein